MWGGMQNLMILIPTFFSSLIFNLINIYYHCDKQNQSKIEKQTEMAAQKFNQTKVFKKPPTNQQNRILEFKSLQHAGFLFTLYAKFICKFYLIFRF